MLHQTIKIMLVEFSKEYLERLYLVGDSGEKKLRYPTAAIKGYQKAINFLLAANRIEDLFHFNSLHYEVLKGDKKGISSIRANDQYRVEFLVTNTDDATSITICNILELSNHYK